MASHRPAGLASPHSADQARPLPCITAVVANKDDGLGLLLEVVQVSGACARAAGMRRRTSTASCMHAPARRVALAPM